MMRIFKLMVAIVAVLMPFVASASSTGVITEVVTNPSTGAINFVVDGARTDLPACANGQGLRWALDGSNAAAQSTVALILSAYAQRKTVYVAGTGACSAAAQANIESVFFLVAKD